MSFLIKKQKERLLTPTKDNSNNKNCCGKLLNGDGLDFSAIKFPSTEKKQSSVDSDNHRLRDKEAENFVYNLKLFEESCSDCSFKANLC